MKTNTVNNGCATLTMLFWLYTIGAWAINLMKFLECDFASPYKQEVIHGLGLIPIFSIVTCWY